MRPSVSKVLLILIGILCASELPILGEAAFPFYDIIHSVAPIWLRATFNGNFYYWTKMVWWGSFVIGDGGLVDNVDQGITACQSCIASHVSPNSNCREDIKDLVKMSISNIIKGIVGWQTGYDPNGVVGNGSPIKRELINDRSSAINNIFESDLENTFSNNITRHLILKHVIEGANILHSSTTTHDNGTTIDEFYLSSDNYGSYRVYHSYSDENTGVIAFSMPNYQSLSNTTSLTKRYPTLDYLCQGYMGVSYCVDTNAIARIADDSSDIEESVSSMYDNAVDGSWTSKFFKLYTTNSDDVTESWQASMRVFYIQPNSHPYETECDTGH